MRRTLRTLAISVAALLLTAGCNAKDSGEFLQHTSDTSTSIAASTPTTAPAPPVATTTTLSPTERAAFDAFLKGLDDAKAAAAQKAEAEKRALDAFLASLAKKPPTTLPPATTKAPATTKPPATTAAPAPTGCTNGTYVNTAGNTVCRPAASPSVPAGATAICGDGTYSFSQSRSGTCSHHGGVARWL
jgi:hypothetical protein